MSQRQPLNEVNCSKLSTSESCGSGGGCEIVLKSNGPGYNDHTQTDKCKAKDAPNVPPENIHKTPRRELHAICVQALRFISFRFVSEAFHICFR